jgi:predicted aspartyl protease
VRTIGILFAGLTALGPIGALAVEQSDSHAQALALLAKHKAFVGWQFGDGTFNSMRITGDITNEKGEKTTSFVFVSSGLVFNDAYTRHKRADVIEREGFTGNLFWETDYNGFTTPVYGDYAKFLASFTALKQEGTTELPASFVGTKIVGGKTTDAVRVTLSQGDPIDLYIDPTTGAYVQATIDPDGAYESTYHILSYKDVLPGKKMISSYTIGDDKDVHTYAKFEPNVRVTSDDLHPPPPTSSWTFGTGATFPFVMTHTRMLVDATINGTKGRFVLDTGADAIVLNDKFADRANAEVLNRSDSGQMLYGEVKTRLRKVQSITLGDATMHNVVAFSQDLDKVEYGDIHWQRYDGLIGFDLFAGAIVRLNVYDSTMAIVDPATDLSAEKGLPIIVDLSQGVPVVPMTLNKTMTVNAMLDTGNPGIIFFGPDLTSKLHFKVSNGCASIDSLSIGPIVYADELACEFGVAANYMLLGFDFLKHFDFVFDYPHGRMFLHPNKN